jgi:cyanophycinase
MRRISSPIQPIYLFADSQLLFWKRDDVLFLESIIALLPTERTKAAYIGASNGDVLDFFGIFESAVTNVGVADYRMIRASYSAEDASFLGQADLILLAGGDVERGWRILTDTGMNDVIIKRYHEGAVLIGTSAGATQLGLYGCKEIGPSNTELFETLKLVPYMIDAHDECNQWSSLKERIALLSGSVRGIGIPAGGGMIYHPDGDMEPIRFAIDEFVFAEERLEQTILLPTCIGS